MAPKYADTLMLRAWEYATIGYLSSQKDCTLRWEDYPEYSIQSLASLEVKNLFQLQRTKRMAARETLGLPLLILKMEQECHRLRNAGDL